MVPKDLSTVVNLAENGRRIWSTFSEKMKSQNNEYVILIPKSNLEFIYYSLLYLNQYCKTVDQKVHIVTSQEIVLKSIFYFNVVNTEVTLMDEDDCKSIISFYNLYMFTDKLFILSPVLPEGRTGFNLVQTGLMDMEEYISVGIYKNRKFVREPLVRYDGDASELIDFFNITREEESF